MKRVAAFTLRRLASDMASFATAFSLLSIVVLWLAPPPIESYSRAFLPHDIVRPGQAVQIYAMAYRSRGGCASRAERRWTDAAGRLVVPPEIFAIGERPKGFEAYQGQAVIPPEARPGLLTMRTVVTFTCNAIQRLVGGAHFPLPDHHFTVLSR